MEKSKQNKKIKNILILTSIVIVIFTIGLICFANLEDGPILNNLLTLVGKNGKLVDSEEENNEFDYGIHKGKVVINYVDETGNKISNQEEIEGIVGTQYETSRKSISHYKTNGEEPINKVGNYKKENINVTYVYEKTEDFITSESENNQVTVQIKNEKQNEEYTLKIIQESEDGKNLTGGEFKLKDAGNEELINGMLTNGLLVLGSINVKEEGEETYKIEETVVPEGYKKALDTDLEMKINKKWNDDTKKYEIEIETNNTQDNVSVEITENNEIIVRLKNEEIKTYNLSLKKFVSSIDGVDTGKEILAIVNEEGNVIYSNADQNIEVDKEQKVVFTIRVFNEGNQEMEIDTVTDIIPDGLKFVEDSEINEKYGWKQVEDTLQSEYLLGKTIKGVNISKNEQPLYEDVQIECEITGEASEDRKIVTTSKINVDERESNKDDNEDTFILALAPEKIKKYDLSIKKFISSIDKEDQGREIIATKNEKGEIEYTSNSKEVCKGSNNQNVIYTLRIFNLGEEDTLGKEIYEYIPDGLEYIEDSEINKENKWEMYSKDKAGNLSKVEKVEDAEILKSEKLLDETIKAYNSEESEEFQYADLQIEFKINENKLTNEDRIITNNAEIESTVADIDKDNNKSEEKIKVNQFDLNLTKYIESIRINTGVYEQTVYLGEEKQNEIYKKEINSKRINNSQIYVTYTLKVKNIGDISGYTTEITDYIPEDMELVDPSGKWERNGNIIKTESLSEKLIEPNEEEKIQLTFVWNLNENNIGMRTNKAYITKYQNEYGAKDLTEDKNNEASLIVSIQTGGLKIAIITILIIFIGTGVIVKYKASKK